MSFWLNHDHHLPISICSVILGNIKATQKLFFSHVKWTAKGKVGTIRIVGEGTYGLVLRAGTPCERELDKGWGP